MKKTKQNKNDEQLSPEMVIKISEIGHRNLDALVQKLFFPANFQNSVTFIFLDKMTKASTTGIHTACITLM